MQSFGSIIVFFHLTAVALFLIDTTVQSRHNGHPLSLRSIRHLRKMGMDNNDIQNLTTTMNFKEIGKNKHSNQVKTKVRKCGDVLRELLIYNFDPSDTDAQRLIAAQLDGEKFKIFTGKISEKEISVEKLLLPVETVGDKCFALRPQSELPIILCSGCNSKRNIWINALHEAMLCRKTRVEGRLPENPGPELQAEAVTLAEETTPTGINIHIADSPKGKPEVMINGMTVQQMEDVEKQHSLSEVKIKPPSPSISDLAPRIINEPEEADNVVNSMNQPRSEEEEEALMESAVEHNAIPASDSRVPIYGYEATKRQMNKHHLN